MTWITRSLDLHSDNIITTTATATATATTTTNSKQSMEKVQKKREKYGVSAHG